jgi:hypothetical protein
MPHYVENAGTMKLRYLELWIIALPLASVDSTIGYAVGRSVGKQRQRF